MDAETGRSSARQFVDLVRFIPPCPTMSHKPVETRANPRNRTFDEYGDVAKLEKLVPQVRNAESIVVTGADHFFTKQLEAVEETMRAWAIEILEG